MPKPRGPLSSHSTHIRHQTHVPIRHRPVPNVFRSSPDYTLSSLRNRCRFSQTFRDESMPARVWDWRGTFARIRRTSDGVGARKFRLKRSCAEKHVSLRRRRCGSSPRGNVVVERRSGTKHSIHISHLRCVPTPNVLVERRSLIKHISHSSHLRCVPTPNVLVERRSLIKHSIHSSHFACVPLRNIAVECTFTAKALRHIPVISTHIRHQTHVPIRHRPVPNVFRSSPDYTFSSLRNRCRFSQTFRDESMPARVWNWRWTFARIRRTSDGVGARKFRLKRSCAGKHVSLRRRRCRSSPRGNVVVERRSTIITCIAYLLLATCPIP